MATLKTKITTPLVSETRAFYQRFFGMVVVEEWDEPGDRGVILGFPDSENEALLEVYHGPGRPDLSALSLQFRVDSAEEFAEALPAESSYEGPTERPWGSTYVYLVDPNGIDVIVYSGGW